jgi:hypothetical protein
MLRQSRAHSRGRTRQSDDSTRLASGSSSSGGAAAEAARLLTSLWGRVQLQRVSSPRRASVPDRGNFPSHQAQRMASAPYALPLRDAPVASSPARSAHVRSTSLASDHVHFICCPPGKSTCLPQAAVSRPTSRMLSHTDSLIKT